MCKKLLFLLAIVVLLGMFSASVGNAATIFLDNYAGVVNGSTTYDPDTRTTGSGSYKVYTTLANVNTALAGGDTLYIRAGNYDNSSEGPGNYNGSLEISVDGTSAQHTVVSAYDDELVVIMAKVGTTNYNPDPGDTTGTNSVDYYPHPAISIDAADYTDLIGLKTYGSMTIRTCHDVLIEGCDLGGGGPTQNQGQVIQINYNAYDLTIRNCKIHHSCWGENEYNGSAIMIYDASPTIENCEFYDNWGADVFAKDTGQQEGRTIEIRNNFFGYSSIKSGSNVGVCGHNQDVCVDSIEVHNNIFYRKKIGIRPLSSSSDNINAYNNTFVKGLGASDTDGDFGTHTTADYGSHNNLHYHATSGANYYGIGSVGDLDYNLYYTASGSSYWYVNWNLRASSLSAWQTYSGEDDNSVETDPDFVDADGDRPEDFKRESYSGDVTGSSYGSMCGAYETGNEVIGLLDGSSSPPSQASSPSPSNSTTGISITANLSWTDGAGSTSSDVYFGTDSTPDSGEDQGNQTATTFEPGTLSNSTTYYWRIDEINAYGTTTGTVWSFTTTAGSAPGAASNPTPADSATDVSITGVVLSWTAGSGATSHDLYGGIDPTPDETEFISNYTITSVACDTLAYSTTYYWRIDEVNANGTTTGTVWSFTTVTAGGQVVEEFGDATNTDHPGTVDDTYTNAGAATTNSSTETTLNTYTWPVDVIANKTIIKWDLSSIPTDATVIDATLYLYQVETGGDTSYDLPVHKIINVNPVITALTWNTYDGTNPWTGGADGGQSDIAAAEDLQVVNATNNVYKTWSVTNMVADWVAAPSGNYGMLVNSDSVASVDSHRFFASNEVTNAATRPKLIVTYSAGVAPPDQASSPSPADSATEVSINADLSWTAGSGATSHDVYFGTDSTPDSGEDHGNQTATTYEPGTLINGTTYYWRIDEINAYGTTTGTVWSFTTISGSAPGAASNPGPADSATDVSISGTYLSWTAGSGATSHDLYGGVDSTPDETEFILNMTGTSILCAPPLPYDTTIYWRVDEINAYGTTTGTVWSFTTESETSAPGQASSPSPYNSATGVSITGDLSWTAGSGATSRDVYFGTSSPGTSQGNQTATTFDTGTMSNNTTYYWRIDEINATGTTTGTVWSFTTTVAAAGQASSPSPSNSATGVSITADLSWTEGTGSTSSDVYFGTSSPGASQGNQTATTFETGTMNNSTTYYWRIDEVNASGTTTGTVWSFTTVASGGGTTEEFGDATNTDYSGTVEDTYANAGSSSTNFSSGTTLNTYTWPADTVANTTIIKWDLTDISTSATVTEATLYLYQTDSRDDSSYDVGVHKITGVDPSVSDLTWATYDGTNSWTGGSDGGLSDIAAAEDTQALNRTDDEYKTWDVTDMVDDWVATPASNYGMMVIDDGSASVDSYRTFASSDATNASTRPKLIVTYSTASSSDVEIIGSWTSGTTHAEEAGSNRALIFTAHAEHSADTSDLGSVTYGGQSMTKVVEKNMHSSYSAYTCVFILDEDGIDAATSSTFVVTWDTAPSVSSAFSSVFLENVNQTTLVGATSTGGTTTTTAETSALSNSDGDMAIVAGTCGNDAAYTTLNSFTEAIEVAPSSADGIGGYLSCTGPNVTPGVSHTNVNRQSVIGFIVQAE